MRKFARGNCFSALHSSLSAFLLSPPPRRRRQQEGGGEKDVRVGRGGGIGEKPRRRHRRRGQSCEGRPKNGLFESRACSLSLSLPRLPWDPPHRSQSA